MSQSLDQSALWRTAIFLAFGGLGCWSCSDDTSHHGVPDGGDTDTESDADTDADAGQDGGPTEWCPALSTSCAAPVALEACGDETLNAPRLIAPLSGKYVRNRRPEIIWDGAEGVAQYRVEISRDRAFTDVVYRATAYEEYPGIVDRFRHVIDCDLDCGVHFFRVLSVTAPECEVGAPSHAWEMYVGTAPFDLDRDGVPDLMCWRVEPGGDESVFDSVQGYAIFNVDERAGQTITNENLVKVAEFNVVGSDEGYVLSVGGQGDVNGDGRFDVGLELYDKQYDGGLRRYYVFTGLGGGETQGEGDAVFIIESIEGHYDLTAVSSNKGGFLFNDIDGDGFSDIILEKPWNQWVYIVRGNVTGFQGDLGYADARYRTSGSTSVQTAFDVNGDGFADILGNTDAYVDEIGSYANSDALFLLFGQETLPAQEEELLSRAAGIWESELDLLAGDWNLGSQFIFHHDNVLGDVDFDGYPEVVIETQAFNVWIVDQISVGAFTVLQDSLEPSTVQFSEVVDFTAVGDFEIGASQDTTESLDAVVPCGDLDGDGIDDFCFTSRYGFATDYSGSLFRFGGRGDWDDLYLTSEADVVDPSASSAAIVRRYLADIDGDGTPELYDGDDIHLSSGAQIAIPHSISHDFCQSGDGLLLPNLLM